MHASIERSLKPLCIALAVAGLATLALACAIVMVTVPINGQIIKQREQLAGLQKLVSQTGNYDFLRRQIIDQNKQLAEKLSVLTEGLQDPADISALLKMLITKADNNGIRFDKVAPQQEVQTAEYTLFPMLLETKTTYHAMGAFISSLEASSALVRIDRLHVRAIDSKTLDLQILVTCFLQRERD